MSHTSRWYRPVPLAIVAVLAVLTVACSSSGESVRTDSIQGASSPATLPPRLDVSVADRARWYRQLRWPAPCEEAFDATRVTDDGGLKFVELEPGRSLVIVRCAGGAYQPSSTLLLLDERGATPVASALELETLASLDGKSLTRAREAEVTGEITMLDHRTLTILTLARQIGDCGTWGRYEFHDGSLVLTAGAERVTCPADPGPRAEPKVGEPPAGWKPIAIQ